MTAHSAASIAWYCVRTLPKHEHIAAGHLRALSAVAAVFLPRLRFRRKRRSGLVWVTEALFPGYLFARFELATSLRLVQATPGVSGVVHFGRQWPTVPEPVMTALRQEFGSEEVRDCASSFAPGDPVQIGAGAFQGLEAVIKQVLPARQRVVVLLEFLGRQTAVELPEEILLPPDGARRRRVF